MRILILGGGGHAKVMIESLRGAQPGAELAILDDDAGKASTLILDVPIVGGRDWLCLNWTDASVAVALGRNETRFRAAAWLREQGRPLQTIVDPSAVVSPSAVLGEGAFLGPGCVVNAEATIGPAAIINTSASVDHDCRVGEAAHIAPGAHLCGGVVVGARSLVGAGAVVSPGIHIGADAIVGAGATVIRNVPDGARVAGTPARPI